MWDLILFEITGRDAALFCLKFQMIYHSKNFYEFPIHLTIYGLIFSEFFAIIRTLEQKLKTMSKKVLKSTAVTFYLTRGPRFSEFKRKK